MEKLLKEILEVVEKINRDFLKNKIKPQELESQKMNLVDFIFTYK